MVTRSPRSRSITSATTSSSHGHRPMSRQSTTSIQSNTTQPAAVQPTGPSYQTAVQMPSTIWDQHRHALSQASHNGMQASGNHYTIDSSLHSHGHGPYNQDAMDFQSGPSLRMGPPTQMTPIESKDNVAFDTSADSSMMADSAADNSKRKKGSTTSQANDNELRRLFRENQDRDLHEVGMQVIKDEKGPKAEKTKQIFGMLWLHTHTKRSSSSVPRNRVFSSYANRCGTERVPPLNPASFGKLVRIIFPGITTRRLGVRGESKYHYVELSLIDDNRPERASVPRGRSVTVDLQRDSAPPAAEISRPHLPADTARFPPSSSPQKPPPRKTAGMTAGHLYPQFSSSSARGIDVSNRVQRPLQFTDSTASLNLGEGPLELPNIEPYLPSGTDVDAVDSLTSVYRSHCLLAVDNFRYCKTDKLCDSYKSLVGLLTVPGQKLLAHPNISPWIRACDWMKYQKMIPMLDMILLTQVPKKAMAHMEHVSQNVCAWISQFFQNQPHHTQAAMLGATNIFASLLERFLRVNRAALDVSQVLESLDDRDQLWRDWVAHVKPLHVLQNSLSDHGHKRVLHILTQEVRFLLSPIDGTSILPQDAAFVDSSIHSEFQLSEAGLETTDSPSSIIARLSRFLGCLATRFPGVDARSLLNYIDVVGNSISRNLTLNGASSLGNWWRIKLFVDEMSYWLAEKGGFLGTTPETLDAVRSLQQASRSYQMLDDATGLSSQSRPNTSASMSRASLRARPKYTQKTSEGHSRSEGYSREQTDHDDSPATRGIQAKQKPGQSRDGSTVVDDDGMGDFGDDSGIAMGLNDDFGIDTKYQSFVQGVHGSDGTGDVVVC